jgi:hypothetical protein
MRLIFHMRHTDPRSLLIHLVCAAPVIFGGCRTTKPVYDQASLWTIETSKALDDACQRDEHTATSDDLGTDTDRLADCIEDEGLARRWVNAVQTRIENNWPLDYLAGPEDRKKCLQALTNGMMSRLASDMWDLCRKIGSTKAREALAAETSEMQSPLCSDLVRMTSDGCFIQAECPAPSSGYGRSPSKVRKTRILCHEGVRKIHQVKDPQNQNLAWNDPFVIDLTGLQSYARVTYGAPNCHGTAQAVAGDILADLTLEGVQFARLYDEPVCGDAARNYLQENIGKPLGDLALTPGGLLINMVHGDCNAQQCGKVNLWVQNCDDGKSRSTPTPFTSAVFIDDMCVECWGSRLSAKGLSKIDGPIKPGCILTTTDHSIFVVHRSAGFCFAYEATSPYGPPQLRASPCVAMENRFERHFCPATSTTR